MAGAAVHPETGAGTGERRAAGTAAAAGAVALWGGGNVWTKAIDLAGPTIAVHRMWLGLVWLGGLFLARGGRLRPRLVWAAAPAGVLFALQVILFFTALKQTTVANATIIANLQPVLLLAVVGPMFGERVGARQLAETGLALGGVLLVVLGSVGAPAWSPRGDLFAVAAVLSWTAYFVVSKRARTRLGALELQAALTLVACVVLVPLAPLVGADLSLPGGRELAMIAVIAVGPGSGHLLMNWAHAHIPLRLASLATMGIPIVGSGAAAVFLDERLTWLQVAGMAVVVVAVSAAVLGERPATAPAA